MRLIRWQSICPLAIIGVLLFANTSCNKEENDNIITSTAIFNTDLTYGAMSDQEGNSYKTIQIGTQTWMAENLRTTLYNDQTSIPLLVAASSWGGTNAGGYCNYNNEKQEDTLATYGRLYNWYAVNTGKLCPSGWHVPSEADWDILINYIADDEEIGGMLKEAGKTHWYTPNTHATNETGFTGLPGGARFKGGSYGNQRYYGYWWTATKYSETGAYSIGLYYYDSDLSKSGNNFQSGFSIRCVKD